MIEDNDNIFGEGFDSNGKPIKSKPKTKPKKKPATQPKKLNSDAKVVHEKTFAAAILRGCNNTDAYLEIYPDTAPSNAKSQGNKFRRRPGVIHAINEGKDEARKAVMRSGDYDLQKAFEEIDKRIERADSEGQHSAVMNGMKLKYQLLKLIDHKDTGNLGDAPMTINIMGSDGKPLAVGRGVTVEGETIKKDDDIL